MSIAHTPSEQIDNYIEKVGKGSTRDALNVALFENDQMRQTLEKIAFPRRGTEEETWDLYDVANLCEAILKLFPKIE